MVSNNKEFMNRFESICLENGILSAFCTFCNLSDFVNSETNNINFVITDSSLSLKQIRSVRDSVSAVCRNIRIGVICNTARHVEETTALSSRSEIISFLSPLIEKNTAMNDFSKLKILPLNRSAALLGYPLKLTPNEYRILILLLSDPSRPFSTDDISRFAFSLDQNASKNQIAVHICNINKKASLISGRALIINPNRSGYLINPCL